MAPITRGSTLKSGRGTAKDADAATTGRKRVNRKSVATPASADSVSRQASSRAANSVAKKTVAAAAKAPRKGGKGRLLKNLKEKTDSQEEGQMMREQARLLRRASVVLAGEGLGLPVVLDAAANADILPPTPRTPASSWNKAKRRNGKDAQFVDMDEILDVDPADPLRRAERWIPEIGFRRRVGRKPVGIPFSIWTAYKSLDDYVYLQSLSDEEVAALPMDDDFWNFYSGGDAPSIPRCFFWDGKRRLVDCRPHEEEGDYN